MIRRAVENDIPRINLLLEQVLSVHHSARPDIFQKSGKKYTDDELVAIIHDDKRPIFVYDDGIVRGYAFCMEVRHVGHNVLTDVKTLYIDDLCVDSASQKQGIGKKLYNFVLEYAKEHNYYNVTLNVWADNANALAFYEGLGLDKQKITMEKIL